MITRKVGFQVIYQTAPQKFEREEVKAITFGLGSDYDRVKTATDKDVQVQPGYACIVQFVDQFDQDAKPLFHGDILSDAEGNLSEIVFYNGGFFLHPKDTEDMLPLTIENTSTKKVIGDIVRNANLLTPDAAMEILKEKTEPKEPPFVDLKLS